MALPVYTQLILTNLALRVLGDDTITSTGEATRRAQVCSDWFETVRGATLEAHPWREATFLTTLYAYSEPAGVLTPGSGADAVDTTGVTFDVASVTPFTSAMASTPEYRIWGDGVPGKATITGYTDSNTVTATINEAFSGSTIASGSWRLYTGAPDGFSVDWSFIIALPSDSVRVWRVMDDNGEKWARVGSAIYTNVDELQVEYTKDLAVTSWTPLLAKAFVYHLAYTVAGPLSKTSGKIKEAWEMYQACLQEARTALDQEGHPEIAESNVLIDARLGGGLRSSWTRRYGAA